MYCCRIILTTGFFCGIVAASGCKPLAPAQPPIVAQPPVFAPPITVTEEVTSVTVGPPVVVQPQPTVPIVPTPVLPQQPVAPWIGPQAAVPGPAAVAAPAPVPPPTLPGVLGGTSISPELGLPAGPEPLPGIPNPISVPVANDEIAWETIAEVVSDYFRISRERRARRAPGIATAGFIETAPQGGATIIEPQRPDSVGRFNRWESTLQSIRRRALITVAPDAVGYQIGVEVQKELEDLPRPEEATAGAAILRNDGSLPEIGEFDVDRRRESDFWIPLGRDAAVEQQILGEIQARLSGRPVPPRR